MSEWPGTSEYTQLVSIGAVLNIPSAQDKRELIKIHPDNGQLIIQKSFRVLHKFPV